MEKTSYLLAGSGILATKRRIFGRKVIRGGGNALPLERIVEPYHGMILSWGCLPNLEKLNS